MNCKWNKIFNGVYIPHLMPASQAPRIQYEYRALIGTATSVLASQMQWDIKKTMHSTGIDAHESNNTLRISLRSELFTTNWVSGVNDNINPNFNVRIPSFRHHQSFSHLLFLSNSVGWEQRASEISSHCIPYSNQSKHTLETIPKFTVIFERSEVLFSSLFLMQYFVIWRVSFQFC